METIITPGQKIQLARKARDVSGRQLAEKIGLSYSWVSLVENGLLPLTPEQYEQIQAVLGFRFDTPEADAAFSFFLGAANADAP